MTANQAEIMFIHWSFVIFISVKSCYSDSSTPETFCGNNDIMPITNILDTTMLLVNYAKKYANGCSVEECLLNKPMDCAEILEKCSFAKTGVYNIWPRSRVLRSSISVYCDMDDDGGGWTVIQRRGDFDSAKDYFYQDWNSYKIGFGDPRKDYWLGNDNIFALTNQRANALKFTLTDWEKNTTYASYEEFWIDDEGHNYTSHLKAYRGTAGKYY
ncbi:techylectin-5A-like [Stegodyphus dumicola]|uniref:techylectin-5A-like n=1 Tax=Stegodyphus dumicola TaxID=202533 RepID=UPI0015B1BDB0|nr:techylectin-5A-like [Stegodyphus dumicola]